MHLSLCLIVKNEAHQLSRCLESVKGFVDEIVLLDTGSTDETVAIARAFNAKVHFMAWGNDFSVARNEALKYVTGDWVLVLDADEVLVPAVMATLKQLIRRPDALVINLVRQEIGAVQSPYSLVSRLFRRHPSLYFSRPYHAMVDDSVALLLQQEPHWQVVNLSEPAILHYGYEPGAIAARDKLQKARVTMEGFLVNHATDPYVCSKLGALYVELGEVQKGIDLLQLGLESDRQFSLSTNTSGNNPRFESDGVAEPRHRSQNEDFSHPSIDAPVLYELHYHLGIAYSRTEPADITQAVWHYQQAIHQPILDRLKLGAYNNLGGLLKAINQLADAKQAYEKVVAIAPQLAIGHYNLGMTLKAMGRLPEAIAHYKMALSINPDAADTHQNLAVALLKVGQVAASLTEFKRAIALHEQTNPAEAERLRQGLNQMGLG
jgi:tetratricopeptide (TPR) repeat protein